MTLSIPCRSVPKSWPALPLRPKKTSKKWLKARGWKVGKYTGKMSQSERLKNQDAFMSGKKKIMVATNAFFLESDKPDIRLIIHTGLPLSLDGYVQEIGHAGRDSKKSRCVLLYSKSDFERDRKILKSSGSKKDLKRSMPLLDSLHTLLGSKKRSAFPRMHCCNSWNSANQYIQRAIQF